MLIKFLLTLVLASGQFDRAISSDDGRSPEVARASTCNQEVLDRSFVTQCGPALCESVFDGPNSDERGQSDWPRNSDEVVQIVSSREDHRFKVIVHRAINTDEFYYEQNHVNTTMFVDTEIKYQRILGFGSTLSDASCKNIDDLPTEIRDKLVSDYFSPTLGIGLNLIRVPIGSTIYSYSNYVLDQPDANQVELSPYDLDHRIPLIKDAIKAAGRLKNRVKLLASSSTAPAAMKRNNKMIHGGYLRQDKFDDYASYLAGFAAAYKSQSLSIWSLILSERPVTNDQVRDANDALNYNSLAMRPSDSISLIKSLRTLQSKRPGELDRFRLLLLGDTTASVPVWADAVYGHDSVAPEVAGIAYSCNSTFGRPPHDNLVYAAKRYPNKYLLAAQANNNSPLRLGDWQYGENYATELVKNLEYGSVGWIDFNLALDLDGGPSISERFKSDAAVIVDTKRGIYYRNPMFYAIGHLSRYVKPGSIRVKSTYHTSPHMYACQNIAFVTPDNFLVVFINNNNIGPMPVNLGYNKLTKVQSLLDTKSFNTFVFRL